ncbi:MAG: ISH3 family transposase, partial [Sulfolobaceae archaeon]|nr:ISH3 family transposase [Sulfolobaceae archaeon]
KFRLLVYTRDEVRRKRRIRVYFARATNLDLPKEEVLRLYNKVRGPIETSYRGIKAFLPFTSSTKFVFRVLVFVLAMVLYSLYTLFKGVMGREEFRLLLILLFSIDLFTENFPFKLIETLIYTIDLFSRR